MQHSPREGLRLMCAGASKESQKLEPGSQDISAAIKKAVIKTLPNFSLKLDEVCVCGNSLLSGSMEDTMHV